jgi:hypothetical protein
MSLGGIQDRCFDRHLYLDEKRQALARWQEKRTGFDCVDEASLADVVISNLENAITNDGNLTAVV